MRLLKATIDPLEPQVLELEEYYGDAIPRYSILSHTWSDDEVLFADVQNNTYTYKKGFQKIEYALEQTRSDGNPYLWVDTCCINKDSSAELSEAINSMYSWYAGAEVCYAYLVDVQSGAEAREFSKQFSQSKWWTRGWTLQELLAPRNLMFFSERWHFLGTKATLQRQVTGITKITPGFLDGSDSLDSASIARRMSWAASRTTTRTEDIAYCLMGIFDVNMPLLYGEGWRAFHRLQEEIMKHSDDQSLFAWQSDDPLPAHGLLADNPKYFSRAGALIPYTDWRNREPYGISNRGLNIKLNLTPVKDERDLYYAAIQCPPTDRTNGYLAVMLKKTAEITDQYVRVACDKLNKIERLGTPTTVYVRQRVTSGRSATVFRDHYFSLQDLIDRRADPGKYRILKCLYGPQLSARVGPPKPAPNVKSWIRDATVFEVIKKANRLTAVSILANPTLPKSREARESICIMLGAGPDSDYEVGFDMCQVQDSEYYRAPRFEDYERLFDPQPMGTKMVLGSLQFSIHAHEEIESPRKVYLIDLVIEDSRTSMPDVSRTTSNSSDGIVITKARVLST